MTFSEALEIIKRGGNVSRKDWNNKKYLELIKNSEYKIIEDETSIRYSNPQSYISIHDEITGEFLPWVASQTDLLANDWE